MARIHLLIEHSYADFSTAIHRAIAAGSDAAAMKIEADRRNDNANRLRALREDAEAEVDRQWPDAMFGEQLVRLEAIARKRILDPNDLAAVLAGEYGPRYTVEFVPLLG